MILGQLLQTTTKLVNIGSTLNSFTLGERKYMYIFIVAGQLTALTLFPFTR